MPDLSKMDPEWAWGSFETTQSNPWSRAMAAHLYRRAGFAATQQQIDATDHISHLDAVRQLLQPAEIASDFEQTANSLATTILAGGDPEKLSAAWVYRLLHTPNQLQEKATVFWHGHFATSAAKVKDAELMWQQNQLLRRHALGSFESMVQGIAQDPAMLIYLDSVTNRKLHPNENFARELMELFCLGEGKYSEFDVQELARCFTGWEIKNKRFRKNRYQQDRALKNVLGTKAKMDGEAAIQVVLSEDSMPFFVCRKLVKFFVCDEPPFSDRLLQPLAETFLDSGKQIAPVVERILCSNLFYSQHALARRLRSPVELCIGVLRALEATTNTVKIAKGLRAIGQGLFYPPNVKGWDGGRAWINSSTLLGRTNLLGELLFDETTKFAGGSLEEFCDEKGIGDSKLLEWLESYLFAVPLSSQAKHQLGQVLKNTAGNREKRLRQTFLASFALPEFQLG